jgi:hypothetical protein
MSNTRRRHKGLSQAGVAAGLAATLLAGGVAVAAGEAPALASSSKIYACYSDTTGALSHLDYPTVKKCPSGGTLISWNASGPQGSRGAKGSQGAKGAQGAEGAQGARGAAGPQRCPRSHWEQWPAGLSRPAGVDRSARRAREQGRPRFRRHPGSTGRTGCTGTGGTGRRVHRKTASTPVHGSFRRRSDISLAGGGIVPTGPGRLCRQCDDHWVRRRGTFRGSPLTRMLGVGQNIKRKHIHRRVTDLDAVDLGVSRGARHGGRLPVPS